MPDISIQPPSIIMPLLAVQALGTLIENIDNIAEHTSEEFNIEYLQEKEVHITATEVITAGVPGNLLCWIELSPYPSANSRQWMSPLPTSTAYWAAIGGGGGAIAPTAPHVEVATGINLTIHSIILPWSIHSVWGRLVVQTPVAASLPTAFWAIQAVMEAKTP